MPWNTGALSREAFDRSALGAGSAGNSEPGHRRARLIRLRRPGTARQLLNDAGHVTAIANYDPYGTPEGAALPSPFGYTGELTDPATGSQYLRARWYRPGQGSLLGVDPALDSTGQPYSYADDNPANGSDPSGRCTVHLAGTEYSYLGAYGVGPCPREFASQIGTVFRQGEGIPCLAVVGDQRYLAEIIAQCVRLYYRFPRSYRSVEELLLERGVVASYERIRRWCLTFGPIYAAAIRRWRPQPRDT